MDSLISFIQSSKKQAYCIVFIVLCLLFVVLVTFYSRESTLYKVEQQTLPAIQNEVEHYQLLTKSQQLLIPLIQGNEPQHFSSWLSQYKQQLELLLKHKASDKFAINKLLSQIEPYMLSIERLAQNNEESLQLKRQSIAQMQAVSTLLTERLLNSSTAQKALFQQSITIFSQGSVFLNTLSLTSNNEYFIALTEQLAELMLRWQQQITAGNVNEGVATSILALDNVLWGEKRTIAKWRGRIRISQEFSMLVNQHYLALLALSNKVVFSANASIPIWPEALSAWLPSSVKNSPQAYYATFFIVVVLLAALLLLMTILIVSRMRNNHQQLMLLIEQRIQGDITLSATSIEQEHILQLIESTITLASKSHTDVTTSDTSQQLSVIAAHTHTLFWTTKASSFDSGALTTLLGINTNQCWYHAFARSDVHQLLYAARQAKRENSGLQLTVKDKQKRTFNFTIEYTQSCWQGTLVLQAHQTQIAKELEKLTATVQTEIQAGQLVQIQNNKYLSKMLVSILLKNQQASLANVIPLKVHHQINTLYDWATQQRLALLLADKRKSIHLIDSNIYHEMNALITNLLTFAGAKNNVISYNIDNHIVAECKLDISLFHQVISHFCQHLLKGLSNARLHIDITMADKNSGQQMLRFAFNVTQLNTHIKVPQEINVLANNNSVNLANESLATQYYYRFFNVTHSEQLQAKAIDDGYQVTFVMPITTGPLVAKPHSHTNFLKINTLFISNSPIESTLFEQLTAANQLILSTNTIINTLEQHLNVIQLTKKAVDVVVIAPDVFVEYFSLINQRLAELPKLLQPKVMVLQPLCNQAFHRVGMYQQSQSLLHSTEFSGELAAFLKSGQRNNLLLPAKTFTQYHFVPTQVEVLLAVNLPQQHEVLHRLLHWMGLKVHIVCNSQLMLKQWQTGRYLILINEFDTSPLLPLLAGTAESRAIYCFSDQQLMQWSNTQAPSYTQWAINKLPNVLDIKALIATLTPWLKSAPVTTDLAPVLLKNTVEKAEKPAPLIDQINSSELIPAFNVTIYSKNQGSPTLAAFMLPDYIAEIDDAIKQLAHALINQNKSEAEHFLRAILTLAKILSANELLSSAKALQTFFINNSGENCDDALYTIQQKFQQVAEYAETI